MTCNEAYNIAIKITEVAVRNLQFFVAICTAVVGWTLAGQTIIKLDPLGWERILISTTFTIPTLDLLIGEIEILKRVNAALDVSRNLFKKESDGLSEAAIRLHYLCRIKVSAIAMGGTILIIDAMILLYDGAATSDAFAK